MASFIRNGEIITSSNRYTADIKIENGRITAIGQNLPSTHRDEEIDAKNMWVIPGGIDAHTHMELPFMGTFSSDDFSSGTKASAVGGTTCIIDFVIPTKQMTLTEGLNAWNEKSEGKCFVDYAFHMAVVTWNETIKNEMATLVNYGITSFKTFMAYKGSLGIDDAELFQVLRRAKELDALVTVHAVNGDVIQLLANEFAENGKTEPCYHAMSQPDILEGEATHRAIALSRLAKQGIYIVHVSCKESMEEVKQARFNGLPVYGETCVQYLLLSDEVYNKPDFEGAKFVLSPPLRAAENLEPLWNALTNGWIQTVATDHCPFHFHGQKDKGKDDFRKIPNGMPGVEDRLNLLHHFGVKSGKLTPSQWVEVCSSAPARIFGMYPQKGAIEIGSDADIVIYDPNLEHVLSVSSQTQNLDHQPYEGWKISGKPRDVLVRGKCVVKNFKFVGEKGWGSFVKRGKSKFQI